MPRPPSILTTWLDLSFGDIGGWDYDEWGKAPDRGIFVEGQQPIIAQVTVSEDADSELMMTEHPIAAGAMIHDHAFLRPAELRLQLGWSNAYANQQGLGTVRDIYRQILTLQASRIPFWVVTGKRTYRNMLIQSLRTHTDQRLEYSFMADVAMREVILVGTDVVGVGELFNIRRIEDPEANLSTIQRGTVQTISGTTVADTSFLFT